MNWLKCSNKSTWQQTTRTNRTLFSFYGLPSVLNRERNEANVWCDDVIVNEQIKEKESIEEGFFLCSPRGLIRQARHRKWLWSSWSLFPAIMIVVAFMNGVEKKCRWGFAKEKHVAAIKLTTLTQMCTRKILQRSLPTFALFTAGFCRLFSDFPSQLEWEEA